MFLKIKKIPFPQYMTPVTSHIITWSLVMKEVDKIFQEFDIYFLSYPPWMGFQSPGTRCFSDIKMLFIMNGKKNTTRNCIQRTDFPIYLRLVLYFYLIKMCYKRGKLMSTTQFTKNTLNLLLTNIFFKIHPLCQHFGSLYSTLLSLMRSAVSTTPSWGFQHIRELG